MRYGGFEMPFFRYAGFEFQKAGEKSGMQDWATPRETPTTMNNQWINLFLMSLIKITKFN